MAIKLFRISDLTCYFKALLSGGSAKSAPSFKMFFALDDLDKLPDFVFIALIHSSAAFSHHEEMEVPDSGI
jgi:hypothetical protein